MEQLSTTLRIATIVVPVALYFLLLGLLNTRRHPQMLSARQDFALLLLALCPLGFQPVMLYFGGGLTTMFSCAGVMGVLVYLLAPRGKAWVIYNIPYKKGRDTIVSVLEDMGHSPIRTRRGVDLDSGFAYVEIGSFPILRNISLRLVGGSEEMWAKFENNLSAHVGEIEAQQSPMAVSLLLVATLVIITPMMLVAQHAPEIVRLLTNLLQ
jgi:hypothetical protein